MRLPTFVSALITLAVGVGLPFVLIPVIGYTSAIAAPEGFFAWFRSNASINLGVLAWELLVVFGPPVGLSVAVATVAICWFSNLKGLIVAMLIAVGALLALYLGPPLVFDAPQLRPLQWWASSYELAIVFGAVAGALPWHRRVPANYAFKRTAGTGHGVS